MAKKPTAAKELPPEIAKIPETFAEGVSAGLAEPANDPAPPQPAPDNVAITPKVMVNYNFVRTDGTSGSNRLFLQGLYDIRSQSEIEQIEKLVMQNGGNQLASVMVTGWYPLES
jgi:hypothetical protein